MRNPKPSFEWDAYENELNQEKHGISFALAQFAFADPGRVILEDLEHSDDDQRFFCLGRVAEGILTVCFIFRGGTIRIFGAGYWRKGRKIYEKQNQIY